MHPRPFLVALAATLALPAALALQLGSFSPQGEVANARQVVARFDAPAVQFGDPAARAPFDITCSDASASQGSGRWISEREWVFDFAQALPPGVRCTAQPVSGFKSPSGADWKGARSYQFNSGGPFVRHIRPGTWQELDEEQFFVLQLSGPATLESVQASAWCSLEGVGERIPVRLIGGAQRAELLQALRLDREAAKAPLALVTLACNRRLTPGSKLQLVVGKGLATPSGVTTKVDKRFGYTVREAFTAELHCERENAQAACLPIRPMAVVFSAPVPHKLAAALRLRGPQGQQKPLVGEDGDAAPVRPDALVTSVRFAPPFEESTGYTLEVPQDLQDASGRHLANAGMFPLAVATGAMPPLAKFAAAPFGVVERFAEGPDGPALLPLTLRKVEAALRLDAIGPAAQGARMNTLSPQSDADIIAWYRRVQYYDRAEVPRKQAARDARAPLPPVLPQGERHYVQSRMLPLLAGLPGARSVTLPRADAADPRPFEVVGVPLAPGFHVLEVASPRLGEALLAPEYGAGRAMYVRTSALVTNLAVHFKLGRENALAWVTSLDKGQPVAGARVQVSGCDGRLLAEALTDAQGRAPLAGLSPEAPRCDDEDPGYGSSDGYFVSARHSGADGVADMAFVWSDWQRGIEPWRFNVPTSSDGERDQRAHTVFDRTLVRAGETVSMKHFLRIETAAGFALARTEPDELLVTHLGSGQEFTQPLAWRSTPTGGRSAVSEFAVPPAAKLGVYTVELRRKGQQAHSLGSGQFRVEAFRLPVLAGSVQPQHKGPLVNLRKLGVQVQVQYVAGGAAARLPVRVSALVRGKALSFADYDGFSFAPPRAAEAAEGPQSSDEDGDGAPAPAGGEGGRIVADKLPLALDANGAGQVTLEPLPRAGSAQELVVEASYADPGGEVQTLRSSSTLWPAAVVAGIKTEGWVASGSKARFHALALSPQGQPLAGVPLQVQGRVRTTTSSRKRIVGGFYSYDNHTETRDLGILCTGKSDARGLLLCEARLDDTGEVELTASARDPDGNTFDAAATVWVSRAGEQWFGGENHDRIDVLPERRSYQPGETARLQVRMPFREATALVAVEREGIIETQVVKLSGKDPSIALKVEPGWGPNVYISVLALRGRLHEVPWYSFFTWGYKAPRDWWGAFWHDGKQYKLPTALVDLSKPAFRFGMAEIQVGAAAHRIDVKVAADQASYPVRGKAQVTISATLPDGKPAAHAEVALAAVDEALLELMPNSSWNLLGAMLQRRAWGVQTATAQMEIIGRRHYGKKAAPPGGGGGRAPTRELLDTLLLWQPAIRLDEKGQARVTVPLNDALSSFRVVAVADASVGLFGTGTTTIRSTQDLQIISGLPPLVRGGDRFRAQITLRNTTAKAMQVEAAPRATLIDLQPQVVEIPAGEARELAWEVAVPEALAETRAQALLWEIAAHDRLGGARDALKAQQRVVPAVPVAVQQGTLVQLDSSYTLPVAPPPGALPGRGGVQLALQPKLAEGLPGVRDWWARYPYSCLEQQAGKAIGMQDAAAWRALTARLPAYLDEDGLASYFPPRAGETHSGSDVLTAHLLAAADEAAALDPAMALPDAVRAPMELALVAFVEGRLQRKFWSPREDLPVRKLAAIAALARGGKAQARMLSAITIAPNQWPTHAVLDWLAILRRVPGIARQPERLQEAEQILRSRLNYQGTRVGFSTEQQDAWWWLMQGSDVNAARLLLWAIDEPAWQAELPRLVTGFIARQQGGAWSTTTANLWGGLALRRFSAKFESTPVAGRTEAQLHGETGRIDWAKVVRVQPGDAAGAPHGASQWGAPSAPGMLTGNKLLLAWPQGGAGTLTVAHHGSGKPWLTVQSLAAVPRSAPLAAGYRVRRSVAPVEQADKGLPTGQYSRGDVLRVTLEVEASADMTWVAITDPIPGGATILGSGLGRDSEIATQGEARSGAGWPAFEERSFEAFRSYYQYLPRGKVQLQYTLRLNNAGHFALPPTRVEALYAPEMFGEAPNAPVQVGQK
ncbi:MAG: alpha-2-macroglobulin [Simplicispira sp.]|nr:alpha-2-macroglobulin [Simplicispira sp.]